jgi:hypothetical protein
VRMGESVMPGNRLDGPGEDMELFVAKAAICALKDGASASGDIVGVPSIAIIANLGGNRGPRCTDSWDPGGYGKEGRDMEAEDTAWLH